jgi:8-oxo-dGTP pyrophosphatase MutT (NUDIX family)
VGAGHRRTSRVVLFDSEKNFLLFFTTAPDSSGVARWITPGGGVDPGETHLQAAVRELFEETGLSVSGVGEPVWNHDFDVTWDSADHSTGHAQFYALSVDRFEPATTHWTPEEHVDVLGHRWWSVGDLLASGELFEPAELPLLVCHLMEKYSLVRPAVLVVDSSLRE